MNERVLPVPVIVESRYQGNVEKHIRYMRACMRDCLLRGEAPYASHGLYTQPGVLRDEIPGERSLGLLAGEAFHNLIPNRAVYVDVGWSEQVERQYRRAKDEKLNVDVRKLGPDWEREHSQRCLEGEARLHWGSDAARELASLRADMRAIEQAADPTLSAEEFRSHIMAALSARMRRSNRVMQNLDQAMVEAEEARNRSSRGG